MNYSSVVTISPKDGSCIIVREPDSTFLNQICSLKFFSEQNLEERAVVDKSLSLHEQIINVDNSSVQTACSSQQAKVRGIGRKCAANFCVDASRTLHTFPLISKKNKAVDPVQVQRCETWVAFCKNVTLQAVPLSVLNKKFFLCANHFQTNQYYREDRKRLLPNAIPNVLCHDVTMDTTETNTINDDFSTVGVILHNNFCNDQIIETESGDNERNNEECAINQATSKDNFCNDQTNDTEKNDTERNNDMCEIAQGTSKDKNINIDRSNNTKNRGRSCAAVSCQSTRLLHAFPRTKVNGVDDDEKLGIVKVWVQNSGNIKLLEVPTSSLHSKFYLCSNHFDDDCFFDCLSKTLLIPNAVPTIFDNNHLSDGDMQQFPFRSLDEIMFSSTLEDMLYDVFQKNFEDRMDGLVWQTCDDCKESFLKKKNAVNLKCLHKKHCHLYCDSNNMDPGVVPPELENLTYVEQQLIARIHTNLSVRRVYSRGSKQLKYRGNTINFPQDVSSIAKVLPHKVNDLPIITVRMQKENDHKDFYVNAKRVRDALIFLKCNNKYFRDVVISEENLNELPENQSIYTLLKGVDGSENEMDDDSLNVPVDDCDLENDDTDSVDDDITNSFVPGGTIPNQDEQVKNVLNWPTIDSTPINEFKHEGYMILAFPSLFPWGKAGLRCERQNKVQPKEYFKHLLRYHDRRFAQHHSFRYFAMNSLMRWESLNDGQAFVKRNSEFAKLNNEELKEKISSNPNLLKKIIFQGKSIRGSKPFWKCRQNELRAMVDQIGLPSLFFTLSAADLHWPHLYRILIGPDRDLKSLNERERRKLLEENPIIVDTFFTMRVEAFIEEVLTPKLNVTDHWFRVEYQHRGSPHIHGVLYCKDAPDVTKVTDINSPEAMKVLKFYDNLISTMNPGQDLPKANEHPCRIHLKDVENPSVGLAQLLNRVQRHTVHSKGYCWRYNKKKKRKNVVLVFLKNLKVILN